MNSTPKWKELEDEIKKLKENQEITAGQECETNEFVDGKQVYVKRIDIPQFPNTGSIRVETGLNVNDISLVRILGTMKNNTTAEQYPLPFPYPLDINEVAVWLGGESLIIATGSDRSDYSGHIDIYYTKNN